MNILISLSAKQAGTLYHKTSKQALLRILRTGMFELSVASGTGAEIRLQRNKLFYGSFTRSRYGSYHYQEKGKREVYGDSIVMLTVDGFSLSNQNKIVPVDYWEQRGKIEDYAAHGKEVEERLVSDKPEIPFIKHLMRVDFIQAGVAGKVEDGMFGRSFRIVDNEFFQRKLGSVILQLKKHKIPFAFFDSMADWAAKRNEYSYIGKKEVSVDSYHNRPSSYDVKDLLTINEIFSGKKYKEMSQNAQKLLNKLYNYKDSIVAMLNDIHNNRTPDTNPYIRKLVLRVSRRMKRLGVRTVDEISSYARRIVDEYENEF